MNRPDMQKRRVFLIAASAVLLLIAVVAARVKIERRKSMYVSDHSAEMISIPTLIKNPRTKTPEISAQSAISMWVSSDGSQEKVLFAKDPDQELLIASLTKLMTADLVLEKYPLTDSVTISGTAVNQGGRFPLGETFSVKTLLYAMLIDSDNVAAYALSEKIGAGTFVAEMNEKAQELGLAGTAYYNAVGFGLKNHSTASDLAKLTAWILRDEPGMFPISITPRFDVHNTEGDFLFTAYNTDRLVQDHAISWSNAIVGNKTGNNDDAGQCLVLVVKAPNGNGYIISVILKSKDRFGEMTDLVNWDLASYDWRS